MRNRRTSFVCHALPRLLTKSGRHVQMCWTCLGHLFNMCQTRLKYSLDLRQARIRHVFDMFGTNNICLTWHGHTGEGALRAINAPSSRLHVNSSGPSTCTTLKHILAEIANLPLTTCACDGGVAPSTAILFFRMDMFQTCDNHDMDMRWTRSRFGHGSNMWQNYF